MTSMNRVLAAAALALALGAPVVAHADYRHDHHDDCRSIAFNLGVQDYAMAHPDENAQGIAGRAIVAVVQALRAGTSMRPTEVLTACGFANAPRLWSLARSHAELPQERNDPVPMPSGPSSFECASNGLGGMLCDSDD